jgi:RNA polymerase sigma-70 factor (ECF subfamily)
MSGTGARTTEGATQGALSDHELMRRHLDGDPTAFGELFRRHKDRMWALALRTTGNRELASDCVQDAFINAYRRAGSFRFDAAFTTWMHRIVVNACLDRLRREKPTSAIPEDDRIADPVDAHASREAVLDVRAALARLPETQRAALVLVDMHGLSVAEAAQVLEVAEGTIKSRCFRGRAALAELLRGTSAAGGASEPSAADRPPAAPHTAKDPS